MDAYPLQWPEGWPRDQEPEYSKFSPGSAYGESRDLVRELELMGATDIVISSNMQLRKDGMPMPRQNINDTGVAVYFNLNGIQQCIPCDRWVKVEENLRAIVKTVNALRGIERWGAKEMVDAAFRGFTALPSGNNSIWYEVLGVTPTASTEEVKKAYLRLSHIHHPDKGGESATFKKITEAFNQGMGHL